MEAALEKALAGEGYFAFPGVLLVRGPDAFSFLQGQATRDLRRLSPPAGTLFLNHRGQIEEAATVFLHPEGFLLAPWGTLEGLRARLRRYIVFDQVELVELPLYRLLHADGREEVAQSGEGAHPAGLYPLYALLKGLPLLADIRGELPQSVGLLHLVDYGKGCYVGQEIMARLEGKEVHHRPVGLRGLAPSQGAPFDLLLEGRKVGEAKRVVETPWGVLGFAVVRQEVPLKAVLEGGGGRFQVEAWPFEEAAWSGRRSSG
ncbi:glycine cleavage system protein T [Thermus amyloliquefaciens]|uniref:glycine cleavage system protein T n=1 Tax=Thermus amyloliquefaciens TaxID=1449080 RepID=UPI00056FCA1C|nr:glycine cleavage system protein T [Thermus amyloliquefaciens]